MVVGIHPLEPRQSFTFHIEGRDAQSLFFRGTLKFEKLCDLEDPAKGVYSIESGNLKFEGCVGKGVSINGWKAGWSEAVAKAVYVGGEVVEVLLKGFLVSKKLLESGVNGVQ